MAQRTKPAEVVNIAPRSKASDGGTRPRSKYPPEAFIVPGQDNNGNSMRVYCRVVPLLDRAMDKIVSEHKFPFHTKGDLMRWCVKYGVEHLEQMEPANGSVLAQVDAMMMVLVDEELNHSYVTLFESMTRQIGQYLQAQALGEARRVVSTMRTHIERMGDGYWRNRYMRELNNKYGYLLDSDNAAGAGIGDHTDGPGGIDEEGE